MLIMAPAALPKAVVNPAKTPVIAANHHVCGARSSQSLELNRRTA